MSRAGEEAAATAGADHEDSGRGEVSWLRANVALAFAAMLCAASGADAWHMPEAALRYKVGLTKKPTHATAGYYVHLPDGGILRGVTPAPVVTTEDGKPLASGVLWMNAESGFSLVFADPGAGSKSVFVYIRTDQQQQFWKITAGSRRARSCAWRRGRTRSPRRRHSRSSGVSIRSFARRTKPASARAAEHRRRRHPQAAARCVLHALAPRSVRHRQILRCADRPQRCVRGLPGRREARDEGEIESVGRHGREH